MRATPNDGSCGVTHVTPALGKRLLPVVVLFGALCVAAAEAPPTARDLIAGVVDLTRGHTSYAELAMVIHRPDWERSTRLVAWTRGREDALIRFIAPPKDAGNATLKQGDKMWTFTPKLNRVIRLPYSMMSQGWAGSDFSYSDLSRSDQLLHQYDLSLVATGQQDGHAVYTIDAIPHDTAPVVWGKEQIVLRDDFVLLAQIFFDQSMTPLKRLETAEIRTLGGRTFGTRMRMQRLDKPGQWTEIVYEHATFDTPFDDGLFTVFALQSGRSE
jgi:outer membrane lipoprotein-sorting protein